MKISFSRFFIFVLPFAMSLMPVVAEKISAQNLYVTIDHVVGGNATGDTVYCGRPLEIHLRLTSTFNSFVGDGGSGVGFKLYSPDGAIWAPIDFDTAALVGAGWKSMFDGFVLVGVVGSDGAGNDTCGFWGLSITGKGLKPLFDQVSWIMYTQVDCSQEGKMICIDSITEASNNWDWYWNTPVNNYPIWDGPYCFTISPCCVGMRGNINRNGGDAPNILDLTWLVGYIFRGTGDYGYCAEESDVNGDGNVANILDLTYMVNLLFRGGPLPPNCP